MATAAGKQLTDCPSNLKEAVDWILRVTGKDGGSGDKSQDLALAITKLPDFTAAIEAAADKLNKSGNKDVNKITQALLELQQESTLKSVIENLTDGLGDFIGYGRGGKIQDGKGVGRKPTGKDGGSDDKPWPNYEALKVKVGSGGKGYYYSYDPAVANWTTNVESASGGKDEQNKAKEKCAKIFLSCLPIVFSGLSYIYWNCKQQKSNGGWDSVELNAGDFYKYMVGMDYHRFILTEKRGTEVVSDALKEFKHDFTVAPSQKSYAEFYTAIHPWSRSGINSDTHSLSTLYLGASAYFTYHHTKNIAPKRPPTTIREMLYFLSALQFSPHYADLQKHIDNAIPSSDGLPVADSSTSSPDNVIKREHMKGFLLSSCLSAPGVLGWLQGPGDFHDEPWLYHLFCNGLNLAYPSSGPALFSTLANYTYALQFQLHFLYLMCRGNTTVCCWSDCRFGMSVEPQSSSSPVTSHICHAGCESTHTSGSCKHDRQSCGEKSASPLQAFLTDCLDGFCRKHPGTSDHLADHPPGAICHVPMGFTANDLRGDPSRSDRIYYTLYFFCGSQHEPLRRLGETLTCLTRRAPRTLGDIFGFVWHLNSQMFTSEKTAEESLKDFFTSLGLNDEFEKLQSDPFSAYYDVNTKIAGFNSKNLALSPIKTSLLTLFTGLPFWYNIFMVKPDESLPARLFNLKSTDHSPSAPTKYSGQHNDLFGLYNPQCSQQACGKYLMPLCFSNGATYAPEYASAYLSWVLYLTDDLESGFEKLLEDFQNIDCKAMGCLKCKDKDHKPGTHGTETNDCSCDSVVHCGGTLPILYSNGFDFYYAYDLCGENNGGQHKKTCDKFHTQLSKVLSTNAPLDHLITTIDTFLYAIRWEFLSKLSGFWTIYICLILYTFFFLLDTLHLRSHLKFISSHTVPPLSLLTSGKPLPFTKLKYLTQ
ncbi:variant erythrocyte surface antigen-1 family protein [Babesia caballi]|uniref:Variant erythrocyte surface antigen-1 family protein n=1 Tax=Babesia caballi TaxID=5871 RepID=A0AAV4LX86_BABCB|nr:variant erythrocyte surface antigen-1 family protein [Babesia caballi]